MTPTPLKTQLTAALFALAFGLSALTGCGGGGDSDDADGGDGAGSTSSSATATIKIDHSSPKKLFDSMMDAAAAGDNAALFAGFPPDTQTEMAAGMIQTVPMAGLMPGADKPGMIAVLKDHGIAESDIPSVGPNLESKSESLAAGIDDKPAFIADMMSKLSPGMPSPAAGMTGAFTAADAVSLTDVQEDGDTASGRATALGQESDDPADNRVHFIRVDGKWYLDSDK
ncbi:MAG: hypothetical protein ACPGYV_00450 [Phycisphaeraceae bacterium]